MRYLRFSVMPQEKKWGLGGKVKRLREVRSGKNSEQMQTEHFGGKDKFSVRVRGL